MNHGEQRTVATEVVIAASDSWAPQTLTPVHLGIHTYFTW